MEELDKVLFPTAAEVAAREVDPETGFAPPSWWKGEEEASQLAASFLGAVGVSRKTSRR